MSCSRGRVRPEEEYAAGAGRRRRRRAVVWDMQAPHERGAEIRSWCMPYMTPPDGRGRHATGSTRSRRCSCRAPATRASWTGCPGVTLCNAAGVHDASTAELALTLTLASIRDIPEFVAAQTDSTLGAAATRSRPRRQAGARAGLRQDRPGGRASVRCPSRWRSRRSPPGRGRATTSCRHGARHRRAARSRCPPRRRRRHRAAHRRDARPRRRGAAGRMPDGALLVNVARGPVVDTDALVAECAAGRLRAALDVTDPEPLPGGPPAVDDARRHHHAARRRRDRGDAAARHRPRAPAGARRCSPGTPRRQRRRRTLVCPTP